MIRNYLGELTDRLKYFFGLSLQTGIFPDPLISVKVTPIFKTGDLTKISNYFPISTVVLLENLRAYNYPKPPLPQLSC